jgi:DNA-binding transcriptional MerR regulator
MKGRYSIGEVSEIFDISIHSLRHYDKIGLLVPSYRNETNGYRYYTFDQFQFISRFKYLRSIGLSLEQIKTVLVSGKSEDLIHILNEIKLQKQKELDAIQELFTKIDFISNYYAFNDVDDMLNLIYKRTFPERKLFVSDSNLENIENMDINLHQKLYGDRRSDVCFLRQFSYILNFDALVQNQFKPLCTGVTLSTSKGVSDENILTLPEGSYVCFCTRILNKNFDINPLLQYIQRKSDQIPSHVIAMEYEDHLHEYYNALYEIQLFYSK